MSDNFTCKTCQVILVDADDIVVKWKNNLPLMYHKGCADKLPEKCFESVVYVGPIDQYRRMIFRVVDVVASGVFLLENHEHQVICPRSDFKNADDLRQQLRSKLPPDIGG